MPSPAATTWQPALRQPDGSLVPERQPVTKAKPAQQVPAGAAVTGEARLIVKPRPVLGPVTKDAGQVPGCECGPFTIDLTTIRTDEGQDLVTSSPDGEVTGGMYQPVIGEMVRPERRHGLGLIWRRDGTTGDDVGGVMYQYDWRIRLGLQAEYQREQGLQPGIMLGVRF